MALSFTGGPALQDLHDLLGAPRVATLYGHVDPQVHCPVGPEAAFRCDLSYLGTYAADRQAALNDLFIEPARRLPGRSFVIGGAPADFPWTENIRFVLHMWPVQHPAFFSSSRLTLSVTRRAMAENGYCPSGRLFEAAACGTPIVSDWWAGLDIFLQPGREVIVVRDAQDVVAALEMSDSQLRRIAADARERVLAEHTSERRARELERVLAEARTASGSAFNQPRSAFSVER